jgi:transmembrane sensor
MDPADVPTARSARAEAAAWIVRLHGPHRSPELEAAFRDWLAAHPDNGQQFERVTEIWDAGASLPVAGVPRMAEWREPHKPRRWILAAAVLPLLVCGLAAWGAWLLWADPTYTTGTGEQRVVRLDDGTRVSLNSGTRIRIAYNKERRRVMLDRGEVYFDVAQDPLRPFTVIAGDREVLALGTVFVIRYDNTQTAVTLLEGKVAILPPAQPGNEDEQSLRLSARRSADELILIPGERVTIHPGGAPKVDSPRLETVVAWRRGEVVLDRTVMADAVAELNRYDKTQLVIDDPRTAALEISGIYQAGDSQEFARAMAKLYDLDIVDQSGQIHLRSRARR